MIYIRAIKQTTTREVKTEATINSEEVAEAIAARVEAATGKDCEAFTGEVGSVVVYNRTQVIARLMPLLSVVDVEPVGGPFDGETVSIPLEAETIGGIRETVNALDRATSHVINAAMHH